MNFYHDWPSKTIDSSPHSVKHAADRLSVNRPLIFRPHASLPPCSPFTHPLPPRQRSFGVAIRRVTFTDAN